jgi:hypothetical protein
LRVRGISDGPNSFELQAVFEALCSAALRHRHIGPLGKKTNEEEEEEGGREVEK